jgi:nucleotide-binding universal stress UspA family protein
VPISADESLKIDQADREAARAALELMLGECGGRFVNLTARAKLVDGSPVDALSEQTARAGMLVLGAKQRSLIHRLFDFSSLNALVDFCPAPVVVIGTDDGLRGKHVVVGVDGSPAGSRALAFGLDFAARHGMRCRIVHAWSRPPLRIDLTDVDTETARVRREDEITALIDRSLRTAGGDRDVVIHRVHSPARPVPALLAEAEDAALLAVGGHGHGALHRALLGSVSHGVLEQVRCPVAVLHGSCPDPRSAEDE